MNRHRVKGAAVTVALLAMTGIVGVSGAVSSTRAAWTDRVDVAATVGAGTWGSNTCTAWRDANKTEPLACAIEKITMKPWTNGPVDYRVHFTTPELPYWVQFTVDLSTAKSAPDAPASSPGEPAWSWSGASVVAAGAQFTPTGGWTCRDLPIVRGQSFAWYPDAYFVVQPASGAAPALCR